MMSREIIAVCFEIHIKHVSTMRVVKCKISYVGAYGIVHVVTAGL